MDLRSGEFINLQRLNRDRRLVNSPAIWTVNRHEAHGLGIRTLNFPEVFRNHDNYILDEDGHDCYMTWNETQSH